MIVVGNKPGRSFDAEGDNGGPVVSIATSDEVSSYAMEDLFADPQVCRRVGSIISTGAERRHPQCRPAPRRDRSGEPVD